MSALTEAIDQHVAVASADAAGTITFVNSAFGRLTGYAKAELVGHSCRSFGPCSPLETMVNVTSSLALGQVWRGELDIGAKDGSHLWVAATVAPLADDSGQLSGYVAVLTDITPHKREALAHGERQRRKLQQNAEELRQYARVASHDLQEPLRAIVGCGQLLLDEYPAAASNTMARQLLDHVIEGGQRMQQLVLALLTYSRVATCPTRRVLASSRAALDKAIGQLAAAIQETGATIEARDLPDVSCDPQQITQLFQHLLDNALKYHGSERPLVRVSSAREGDHFHFMVADNGIGIEPRSQGRIFELFQRLHARGEYSGVGLGLAICKKIVEGLGGEIWVDSEKNRGTTVHFTLPTPDAIAGGED